MKKVLLCIAAAIVCGTTFTSCSKECVCDLKLVDYDGSYEIFTDAVSFSGLSKKECNAESEKYSDGSEYICRQK